MARTLTTRPFTIRRGDLVRVAAEEYVRRFWWIIVGVPISGLAMLLLVDHPVAKYLGFVGVCWPLTIPARSVLITRQKAKRLARETWVTVQDDTIYFHDRTGGGMKLGASTVSGLRKSGDLYVIQTRTYTFAVVPISAFESEGDRDEFESLVRGQRA